jgi:hypothetical protein
MSWVFPVVSLIHIPPEKLINVVQSNLQAFIPSTHDSISLTVRNREKLELKLKVLRCLPFNEPNMLKLKWNLAVGPTYIYMSCAYLSLLYVWFQSQLGEWPIRQHFLGYP